MLHLFAVRFRFIVFRPFVDEILVGKIRSCSTEGVRGTVNVYSFVIDLGLGHSCRCVKEGVNFLCDVLVCSFICFNQCLMPSSHTKLCSSFYFGCQLSRLSLHACCWEWSAWKWLQLWVSVVFLPVSLGFFDDILIPHHSLQHPKRLYPTLWLHGSFMIQQFQPWSFYHKLGNINYFLS